MAIKENREKKTSEDQSFQRKLFLLLESAFLLEAAPFSENHSLKWEPSFEVEVVPFSGSHSFQSKIFLFSGSHSL